MPARPPPVPVLFFYPRPPLPCVLRPVPHPPPFLHPSTWLFQRLSCQKIPQEIHCCNPCCCWSSVPIHKQGGIRLGLHAEVAAPDRFPYTCNPTMHSSCERTFL